MKAIKSHYSRYWYNVLFRWRIH